MPETTAGFVYSDNANVPTSTALLDFDNNPWASFEQKAETVTSGFDDHFNWDEGTTSKDGAPIDEVQFNLV